MSLLKAIKAQLGLSNTPANNFTLDASADNGTLKLARGNAGATTQDILTVDAAGKVAFPQNAQNWQSFDVPTLRQSGTTYTNTEVIPITVAVTAQSAGASGYMTLELQVDGLPLDRTTTSIAVAGEFVSVSGTVPPGKTYSVTLVGNASPAFVTWRELR